MLKISKLKSFLGVAGMCCLLLLIGCSESPADVVAQTTKALIRGDEEKALSYYAESVDRAYARAYIRQGNAIYAKNWRPLTDDKLDEWIEVMIRETTLQGETATVRCISGQNITLRREGDSWKIAEWDWDQALQQEAL